MAVTTPVLRRGVLTFCVLLFGAAVPARAQSGISESGATRWGASITLTPKSEALAALERLLGAETVDLDAQDFTVGGIRSLRQGGELGLSLSLKRLGPSATVRYADQGLCPVPDVGCPQQITAFKLGQLSLVGAEIHGYGPLFGIGPVEVGLVLGVGVIHASGTVVAESDAFVAHQGGLVIQPERSEIPVRDFLKQIGSEMGSFLPTARAEVALGVRMGAHFRFRVSAGVNFPSRSIGTLAVSALF